MEDLEQINKDLPFDIVDDLAIYMRNDPTFYRKSYFPALEQMKASFKAKKKYNAEKHWAPIIDSAITSYCKKFNIPNRPVDLVDDNDKKNLIKKIYSEEMTQIRKGTYDK